MRAGETVGRSRSASRDSVAPGSYHENGPGKKGGQGGCCLKTGNVTLGALVDLEVPHKLSDPPDLDFRIVPGSVLSQR